MKLVHQPKSGFTLWFALSPLAKFTEYLLNKFCMILPIFANFTKIDAEIWSLWPLANLAKIIVGTQKICLQLGET